MLIFGGAVFYVGLYIKIGDSDKIKCEICTNCEKSQEMGKAIEKVHIA